jgi:hypothetical protein
MTKKILLLLLTLSFANGLYANTLVIDAQKYGETEMHLTELYVLQAGVNAVGDYIIRFENGQELSLGKPTDYQKFYVRYIDDNDIIAQ